MNVLMLSGIIAFVTTIIGLFPQIYKAIKTKSTQDLSMMMLVNYAICSAAWVVYGRESDSLFVLYSNVLNLLVCFYLIALKYRYDSRTY